MHSNLDIDLPSEPTGCELCYMFCFWAKWIRDARPEVMCPSCSRALADGRTLLTERSLDHSINQLLPESYARGTNSLGYCQVDTGVVCFVDLERPNSIDTHEKLRFILNRNIYNLHADGDVIATAINYYYGTES